MADAFVGAETVCVDVMDLISEAIEISPSLLCIESCFVRFKNGFAFSVSLHLVLETLLLSHFPFPLEEVTFMDEDWTAHYAEHGTEAEKDDRHGCAKL